MTRSLLQPIRTRRIAHAIAGERKDAHPTAPALTPGTRETLAAIGALWLSFASSASTAKSAPTPDRFSSGVR
jgi:hypothetical protein